MAFQQTQAMVLPGPPQRFVIRGIARRPAQVRAEQYECKWADCGAEPFDKPEDLVQHAQQHLADAMDDESCSWGTCEHVAEPGTLPRHIAIHLPAELLPLQQGQPDSITVSAAGDDYPIQDPTSRPLPAPPKTVLTYLAPKEGVDPPQASLSALLILRTLFRTSFASRDLAPRADADHVGFPGLLDEEGENEEEARARESELDSRDLEGERRGKRAFLGVRNMMKEVAFADPVLQDWMMDMVDQALGDGEE